MRRNSRFDQQDPPPRLHRRARGYTLVEILIATSLLGIIVIGLSDVTLTTIGVRDTGLRRAEVVRDAQFALQRMTRAVRRSPQLLVPMREDPKTGNVESMILPGTLAVVLDPTLDRNQDGIADADNDGDGRIDEDWPADTNNDGTVGIRGVDDDSDGFKDFSFSGVKDDDETGTFFAGGDEDPVDGIDNDGDGSVDEDPGADMNGDGAPGIAFVDDDGDGNVDEGAPEDDDEDGTSDEDWLDPVVFFLSGTSLIERHPNPTPADGRDYTERTIAENVTSFGVERLAMDDDEFERIERIELTLTLTLGEITTDLQTRVRVGSSLSRE